MLDWFVAQRFVLPRGLCSSVFLAMKRNWSQAFFVGLEASYDVDGDTGGAGDGGTEAVDDVGGDTGDTGDAWQEAIDEAIEHVDEPTKATVRRHTSLVTTGTHTIVPAIQHILTIAYVPSGLVRPLEFWGCVTRHGIDFWGGDGFRQD
jgi:hypothetical protein